MVAPMLKRTPMQGHAEWGDKVQRLGADTMNKVAYQGGYMPPKIEEAIRWVNGAAKPGCVYLLDRALGAGEYYGANNNGDYFPEQMLIDCHETFEKHAHVYRHHKTDQPNIGNVLTSAYNDRIKTVDLLLEIPIDKIAEEIRKIGRGLTIQTSMGCAVPYDVCRWCGQRASTRAAYCGHLRHFMLRMLEGKQVYAINERGVFKDISMVFVPAAAESAIFSKVAGVGLSDCASGPGMPKQASPPRTSLSPIIRSGEDRGAVQAVAIKALSHLKTAAAILTLHEAVGVLRPDEFVALMRKDAAVLQPGIVPLVRSRYEAPSFFTASPITKLAETIQNIPLESTPDEASFATWIGEDEVAQYLRYRASVAPAHSNSHLYLR